MLESLLVSYNPAESPSFSETEAIFQQRLTEAGTRVESTRSLDRQYATKAMLLTLRWVWTLVEVGPLSSVLRFMQLAAPIFRRACPGPLDGLVNLPDLFTTGSSDLRHYGHWDIIFGVLTGRPMFFRYAVNFTSEAPESLFLLAKAPDLRSVLGVPDRLSMTLARMNGLYEDFGSHVPSQIVNELEQEIEHIRLPSGPSTEPPLSIRRATIQQCWFQAALIYLYMGLRAGYSTDAEVVKVQTRFIRILESVKPRRNTDLFLVFPMFILGLATTHRDERDMIRRRMLGVSECSRPGRMGNDFIRMLANVWSKDRPVVWRDLRQACWEVA
ncbi:unnamed protein product, partial [Rhizoctonia solani]